MRTLMRIILVTIFPLIFCIAFFTTVDTADNKCAWISFIFVRLSYLLLVLTKVAARFPKGLLSLNENLWSISIVYFLLTVVTDFLFVYEWSHSRVACILVNLLFVLVYTVIYALSYLSNKKIEDKENE